MSSIAVIDLGTTTTLAAICQYDVKNNKTSEPYIISLDSGNQNVCPSQVLIHYNKEMDEKIQIGSKSKLNTKVY